MKDSPHRSGNAVDLWPLDAEGGITFDPKSQSRIGAAMRRAAAELGVLIRWGGNFHSFKHLDRSHFDSIGPMGSGVVSTFLAVRTTPACLPSRASTTLDGLFIVHHGVGSERWRADGFTRLA